MQKALRELAALKAERLPTPEEIQAASLQARQAVARLALMKNAKWRQGLALKTAESRLRERLQLIAERSEVSLVGLIRKKLGVEPANQSTQSSNSSA